MQRYSLRSCHQFYLFFNFMFHQFKKQNHGCLNESDEPFELYGNLGRPHQNIRSKPPRTFSAAVRLRQRRVRATDTGRASSVSRGERDNRNGVGEKQSSDF